MIAMFSCSNEPEVLIATELQPYIDEFIIEGESRGKIIDLNTTPIEAKFQNIIPQNVAGMCNHNSNKPNVIVIDVGIWEKADELIKEYIMFHELGHCFLNRGHLEGRDADGNCISMMQSGTSGCKVNYTEVTREDYLDELFN
jgi:hypothetical protein